MDGSKKSLKQEIGRLQIKVNAITGLNFQSEIQKLLCDSADRKLGPDMEGTFSNNNKNNNSSNNNNNNNNNNSTVTYVAEFWPQAGSSCLNC